MWGWWGHIWYHISIDQQMDGWLAGWMDRWMDGWMLQTHIYIYMCVYCMYLYIYTLFYTPPQPPKKNNYGWLNKLTMVCLQSPQLQITGDLQVFSPWSATKVDHWSFLLLTIGEISTNYWTYPPAINIYIFSNDCNFHVVHHRFLWDHKP